MAVIVRKVGNSMTTTIPYEIIHKLGIRPGDEVLVSEENGTILLKPIKKKLRGETFLEEYFHKPIEEIGQLDTEIVDWGQPQGEEVW